MDIDNLCMYFILPHPSTWQKCGTRTGLNMCRHLLMCLWTWNLWNSCCVYDIFWFNPRSGTRLVQVPAFQQTEAHPYGRSEWLPPLLVSGCWRPGLRHWEPSDSSWRRKSEPGRKTEKEQQMLATSAAKTFPHLSVPCWVLHCLTVNYVLLSDQCHHCEITSES